MKILLVSPLLLHQYLNSNKNKKNALLHNLMSKVTYHQSLSLPILASITPKKHQIEIQKTYYKNIDLDGDYDLVGIRCTTTDSTFSYKVADEFRKRGVTVILGGWHPSAMPYEAKKHADSVVIGEGEDSWLELLEDFEKNNLKPFYWQKKPVDLGKIPILLHYSNTKDFSPAVQATRGCPYQCDFCSETIMRYRSIFRHRPIEKVVEEIKSFKNNFFIFHDASLTINPEYSKDLFNSLIGLKKRFFCNGNADTLSKDEELLDIAKKAGCIGWLIGFESISEESLKSVNKKTNRLDEYINAIKTIHDYGMMVSGSFVFGFDGDTEDIFENTLDFVKKSEMDLPDAMILTPFPGTPLFTRLEKEGRILTKNWLKYDHRHVVFKPKNMTAEELLKKTIKLYNDFFSYKRMSIRILKSMKLGYHPFLSTLFQNLSLASLGMNLNISE